MRPLRWLLSGLAIAVSLLAAAEPQESGNEPNAAVDQALRDITGRALPQSPDTRSKDFWQHDFAWSSPEVPLRVCSVPLLELPIPKDKRYTMKVLPVPNDRRPIDNMPAASGPAPPCPARHE